MRVHGLGMGTSVSFSFHYSRFYSDTEILCARYMMYARPNYFSF